MIAWYAGLDAEPLAAMALTGPLVWSLTVITTVTTVGTTALVARRIGEGDLNAARLVTSTALGLALLAGAFVALLGVFFGEPLVASFAAFVSDATPQLTTSASGYLFWIAALFPLQSMALLLAAALRGAGDSRTPMWGGFLANYVNIIANSVLIFGLFGLPAMGVAGAGLGTALGAGAEFLFLAVVVGRSRSRYLSLPWSQFLRWNRRWARKIVAISAPALLDAVIFHAGFMVYQLAIYDLDQVAVAAHRVAITIQSAAFLPAVGFAASAASLSGRLLGAGQPDAAQRAAVWNLVLGVIAMLPVTACFLISADVLVRFFTPVPEIAESAALCLRIGAIEVPFLLATNALTGTLRGAGETREPVYVSALGTWLVRVPFAWGFSGFLGWGLTGVWIATVIDWMVRALLLAYYYRRGRWLSVRV